MQRFNDILLVGVDTLAASVMIGFLIQATIFSGKDQAGVA